MDCLNENEIKNLEKIAKQVRTDILNMVYKAQSGHLGGSFSCVEIMLILFSKFIDNKLESKFRHKFVLSKGHASATYYSVLARLGVIDVKELETFRFFKTRLQGHPSSTLFSLCDVSSGSLGQGLSIGAGMAIGRKLNKNDNKVFVLLGDGELQEGSIWESLMSASHYNLDNLIAIIDKNELQIDGNTEEVMSLGNLDDKLKAFGFNVINIDGHNYNAIYKAICKAIDSKNKPNVIIANTIKGKGVSFMCQNASWHGKPPKENEYKMALGELL